MSKIKPQRANANETREKIIEAALELFMRYGFAGTSMGKLAEAADVTQSLISHHFGNKQQLWMQVKATIIDKTKVARIHSQPKNLREFIEEAVHQRLEIYAKSPELSRLVNWQRLEDTERDPQLAGFPDSQLTPSHWIEPIQHLQNKGLINKKLSPHLILIWITHSVNGYITDDLGMFANQAKNKKQYVDMIVNGLEKALA